MSDISSIDVVNILSNVNLWYIIATIIGLTIMLIVYNAFKRGLRRR